MKLAKPKPLVVPILRAGLGMLDGMMRLLPTAEVGFLGMMRNEETLEATTYAERLPEDLAGRQCYVLDPMLATGGTLSAAIKFLTDRGANDITAICLLAAPEGCARLESDLAGLDVPVTVVTAAMDEKLNEKGYIVPGLGDAGDRLYGVVGLTGIPGRIPGRPGVPCRRKGVATPVRGQFPRAPGETVVGSERLDRGEDLAEGVLGVTEQQRGLGLEEQLVLDAGEAGAHRPLEEHDLPWPGRR